MAATLKLTVVTYAGEPRSGLLRRFTTGRATIGRGSDNDWVLPDPEKHLSSRHCVIEGRDNEYVITDVSKNGVFLNGAEFSLGNSSFCTIADGDLIAIGDYQLRAEIEGAEDRLPIAADVGAAEMFPRSGVRPGGSGRSESPFGLRDDLFPRADPVNDPLAPGPGFIDPGRAAPTPAGFPDPAFDPQGSGQPSYPNSDHVPAMGTFFRAPEVQEPIIPPDWNPLASDFQPPPSAIPPVVSTPPQTAPSEPEPPVVRAPAGEAPKHSVDASAIDVLRAFLEGAGLSPPDPKTVDVGARMRGYGEIMRELIAGIRELLAVRTLTKSEFRIEQTMIRPVGNNPLKFSVDLEQALSALLLPQRSGYAEPLPAAREAIADLKSHELSVIAGMQKLIAKLLAGLSPDEIERHVESTGLLASLLPSTRKARYWEAYEAIYNRLVEEYREGMRSSVRQAFAEAYFDQAKKL